MCNMVLLVIVSLIIWRTFFGTRTAVVSTGYIQAFELVSMLNAANVKIHIIILKDYVLCKFDSTVQKNINLELIDIRRLTSTITVSLCFCYSNTARIPSK